MRFWDSSAIVTAVVPQSHESSLNDLIRDGDGLTVWWGTTVECASAIARIEREARIDAHVAGRIKSRIVVLEENWSEIPPSNVLRDRARLLLTVHSLRAADALQLAAALVAAEGKTADLPFVCLDNRLCDAARKEGFAVLP